MEYLAQMTSTTKYSASIAKNPAGPKKETVKWQRVHDQYMLNSYQGSKILYLEGKGDKPTRRVVTTHELFETLERLHKIKSDHTAVLDKSGGLVAIASKECCLLA